DVVWLDKVLYIDDLSTAKLARVVPERLGNIFDRSDVTAALNYCFCRSTQEVSAYLEENFLLAPKDEIEVLPEDGLESARPQTSTPDEGKSSEPPPISTEDSLFEDANVETQAPPELQVNGNGTGTHQEMTELDNGVYKMRPLPKPQQPSIIECFARSKGFRKDGDDCFCHADGSQIAKAYGSPFHWELRTANGEVIRYYWPKEHCLEREPLQLESDVWGLIKKFPELYSLVLASPEDDAVEWPGSKLQDMVDGQKLTLYPATYRLVHGENHGS
ncbi:MAG: ATPase, partial [Armatimonadota bacterium]